jgi:hypothetical protein
MGSIEDLRRQRQRETETKRRQALEEAEAARSNTPDREARRKFSESGLEALLDELEGLRAFSTRLTSQTPAHDPFTPGRDDPGTIHTHFITSERPYSFRREEKQIHASVDSNGMIEVHSALGTSRISQAQWQADNKAIEKALDNALQNPMVSTTIIEPDEDRHQIVGPGG